MEINEIVREIRAKSGLTQEKFAKSIGISRSSLTQIETGKSNATLDIVSSIIEVYNVSPLVFFKTQKKVPKIVPNENLTNNNENIGNISLVSDNEMLSNHDLSLLKQNGWVINLYELAEYLNYSESKLKAILSSGKNEVEEKISTLNAICNIASKLELDKEDYYKHRFTFTDPKKYLKAIFLDEDGNKQKYDNEKLEYVILIFKLKESINHFSYLIDDRINYLEKGVDEFLLVKNLAK